MTGASEIELRLAPYQNEILLAQTILLWRRPGYFAAILISLDAVLIWAWYLELGLLALIFFLCLVIYLTALLLIRFRFSRFFDTTTEIDTEGLYNFDEICVFIESVITICGRLIDFVTGKMFVRGPLRTGLVFMIWMTIAFIFNLIGKFWVLLFALNLSLCVPGLFALNMQAQKEHAD